MSTVIVHISSPVVAGISTVIEKLCNTACDIFWDIAFEMFCSRCNSHFSSSSMHGLWLLVRACSSFDMESYQSDICCFGAMTLSPLLLVVKLAAFFIYFCCLLHSREWCIVLWWLMSMSVCLTVCVLAYVRIHMAKLHQMFCIIFPMWTWLGPPLIALQYVLYFCFVNRDVDGNFCLEGSIQNIPHTFNHSSSFKPPQSGRRGGLPTTSEISHQICSRSDTDCGLCSGDGGKSGIYDCLVYS